MDTMKKIMECFYETTRKVDNYILEQLIPYGITNDNYMEYVDRLEILQFKYTYQKCTYKVTLDGELILLISMELKFVVNENETSAKVEITKLYDKNLGGEIKNEKD